MTFRKGQSGNPQGRPKGTKDKRTATRELLEPHAESLIDKAVELALKGDTTALKMCLDRLVPTLRSIEHHVVSKENSFDDVINQLAEKIEKGKIN